MRTAPALLELQHRFMAALYGDDEPGLAEQIIGNGLAPSARLRIYQNSSEQIHEAALRISYPAVLAFVGEDFFDQAAAGYRRASASRSGNLQEFGAEFAEFLEWLPQAAQLPYLGDVARLEWRRQLSALAAEHAPLSAAEFEHVLPHLDGPVRIVLHPSLQTLASRYPALSLWNYAIHPDRERFELAGQGENIALWRSEGEVAMAAVDAATCACIESLAQGNDLDSAHATACARDTAFNLSACILSLLERGLIVSATPFDA